MLLSPTMDLIRKLNTLRKSKDGLNPVAFGWAMLLATSWPVFGVIVVVSLISVFMIVFGRDPTELVVSSASQKVHVPSIPVPAMVGGWMIFTYLYLLIGVFIAAAFGRRYATHLIWTRTCRALPSLRDRIAAAWRSIATPTSQFTPSFTGTDPLTISVQKRFPIHHACGWRASVNPQIR